MEEGCGRVSGIFQLSRRAKEQAVAAQEMGRVAHVEHRKKELLTAKERKLWTMLKSWETVLGGGWILLSKETPNTRQKTLDGAPYIRQKLVMLPDKGTLRHQSLPNSAIVGQVQNDLIIILQTHFRLDP